MFFDYYHAKVPIYQEVPCDHPILSKSQNYQSVDVSDEQIRNATACYYGMIETVDTHYGQIINKLKEHGEDLDEWIVVYTSDHGEMLGEHGIWEKTRFYEGSVKVPLIIRWPKGFEGGRVIQENVNLCDLFATLCDLCGIDVPEGLDSRSLKPLLLGDKDYSWNNEVISQIETRPGEHHVMIKKDHLKYQNYGPEFPEVLFDLKTDPKELINRMGDDEYRDQIAYFRETFRQYMKQD